MFLRPCFRFKDGKPHAYWALVESYRTARGSRQRVVAYLGALDEERDAVRSRVVHDWSTKQQDWLRPQPKPLWVQVDAARVEVRRARAFGGVWLGWQLVQRLELQEWLRRQMPRGREEVAWPVMTWVLVLARLCDPSSELYIAEHLYAQTALADLLGVPEDKINEDRLYRALDALLPHKLALEKHLKERLGELFALSYDLLLYDVTSTYFEGEAAANPQAQRGYSRDRRGDCKQVCIALVVARGGLPLGYELFDGNRTDVTTVRQIVETMEARYGKADRVWVMDRGMVSEPNLEFLRGGGRRYIVGTARGQLRAFEQELLSGGWREIREGLEVKWCAGPTSEEVFILCRSADRRQKERAIHERFERRIEEGLDQIATRCARQKQKAVVVAQRVGRLLGRNSRAAGLFAVQIGSEPDGRATLHWTKKEAWRQWAALSEGCYLLHSNVTEWTAEELWRAYIQLTEAESAFRIQKSDLSIRPIWHQKKERVQAHILVCFLAYVLWKTLGQMCRAAGLGDEPRRVFDELGRIRMVDVVLPTKTGPTITRRCITRPTAHQAILLQRLGLVLPKQWKTTECSEDF
jgi:transposase